MSLKIGVCSRSFSKNQALVKELGQLDCTIIYHKGSSSLRDKGLIDFLQDKTVAILGLEKITSSVLDACSKLKVICKMGTGTDKVDIDELKKRDIHFFNTPGFNKYAVAELVLTHALTLVRNIKANIHNVDRRQWKQQIGGELRGKCLGLLGFGAIGQEVARVFYALGCHLIAYDINHSLIEKTEYVKLVTKEELFLNSDMISIHTPLSYSTRNLVDAKLIDLMKNGTVFINTSRGEVVDQDALVKRLITGDILAGLDVLHNEPEVDFSLSKLPNVLVTPHVGGSTFESILSNGREIISYIDSKLLQEVV